MKGMDKWIIFAVIALVSMGIIMVFGTSYLHAEERFSDGAYFLRRQLIATAIGLVALAICTRLSPRAYRRLAYPAMALCLLLLVLVLIPGIGVARGGARRWLELAGFSFQPAEFAKLAVVLYLARSLAKKENQMDRFSVAVLPHLLVGALFAGLVVLQPDLGTACILGLIVLAMLFAAGARLSHLALIGVLAAPALGFLVLSARYRLRRLFAFLDPWSDASSGGFQIIQSYIAFGSGRLWGRGLGESRQKLSYLPEAHTDFIFSVIGEELGLLGTLGVLALFGILLYRGFRLALKIQEPFGRHLAFGLTLILGLQALIHMGVVMGLVPTKGLVLPFISYGGSAMVMNLATVGIMLGLSRRGF